MEGIQVSAYNVGSSGDIVLLQVGGYIDNVTSSQLEVAIGDVLSQGIDKLIVDLAHVSYISSAGWGVFLGKIKGLRENGGDLLITQMVPDVTDVFELLEFHRVLKVFESNDEAVSFFEAASTAGDKTKSEREPSNSLLAAENQDEDLYEGKGAQPDRKLFASDSPADPSDEPTGQYSGTAYVKNLLSLTEENDSGIETSFPAQGEAHAIEEATESNEYHPTASFYDSLGMPAAVMDRDLPLSEKIKLLVVDNPLSGVWKIKSALNSSRFGYIKVGFFEVRRILRELDLDSKGKRYRFWRSR